MKMARLAAAEKSYQKRVSVKVRSNASLAAAHPAL
jgi:hypothetical protein